MECQGGDENKKEIGKDTERWEAGRSKKWGWALIFEIAHATFFFSQQNPNPAAGREEVYPSTSVCIWKKVQNVKEIQDIAYMKEQWINLGFAISNWTGFNSFSIFF